MTRSNELEGKCAIVTGGSGGNRQRYHSQFAGGRAAVATFDLSPPRCNDIPWFHCDVRSDESVRVGGATFFKQLDGSTW